MDNYERSGVYVVYDKVACRYGPSVECPNDDVARRMLRQTIDKVPEREKQDYIMYRLGWIERTETTCQVIPDLEVYVLPIEDEIRRLR